MDSSIDNAHMRMKFIMCILGIQMEGNVSQDFDLGPSFYFIKCRILSIKNIQKVTRFLTLNKN